MEAPRSASLGRHEEPDLELSHFVRRVVGCCHHALALTPRYAHNQSRALSLQRLSPPSSLLWAPRTPPRHGGISHSAYTHRLCPTWTVEKGLPSSASGYPCVPSSIPQKRPAPLRSLGAVSCLRPVMTGSAASPFGFFYHGAAKFTLFAFGPLVCSPRLQPYGCSRAFDAPLRRRPLKRRLEPATRRSGAYRGGTFTRKSDVAPWPSRPHPASFRTHHGEESSPFGVIPGIRLVRGPTAPQASGDAFRRERQDSGLDGAGRSKTARHALPGLRRLHHAIAGRCGRHETVHE